MSLNKYSTPQEVKRYHYNSDPKESLKFHIETYYPNVNVFGFNEKELDRELHSLVTKAMQTL